MLGLFLAAILAGESPPAAANPPVDAKAAPQTAQAMFDAATAASEKGQYDEAIRLFETLEARPATARSPSVLGIILIRKGLALYQLDRLEEAETSLDSGLKLVRSNDANLRGDLLGAHMGLARIAFLQLDYERAAEQTRLAEPFAQDPDDRFQIQAMLTRATMFDEDGKAVQYADAALAIATSIPDPSKKLLADVHTLHARAWLIQGRQREAYAELKKALAQQGGLGFKVTISDIRTRSDLAIAALLNGDKESARQYMAYTGAGRTKTPFETTAMMAPPPCGGSADLRPDDSAIVEFNIRDDGSVGHAIPVYASRPGAAALEFARAVNDWSWSRADAAKIPAIFRAVTRVELRCSNAVPRPATIQQLWPDVVRWFTASKIAGFEIEQRRAAAFIPLKAELARREAAGEGSATIPILVALGLNPMASFDDQRIWLTKARDIAITAGAPPAVRAYLEIVLAASCDRSTRMNHLVFRDRLRAILTNPAITGDAKASDTLRLMIAEPAFRTPAPADAEALITLVANDTRLAESDPLRVGALVRLAALRAAAGDLAGARENYTRTGLGAQQCALLDAKPALLRTFANSSDFPMAAMQWGFEGWVKLEYDILANGKTTQPRAVIAYPPFVFRDAAVGMANDFRYSQSYRPDGAAGCSGEQQNVNFRIPDQH